MGFYGWCVFRGVVFGFVFGWCLVLYVGLLVGLLDMAWLGCGFGGTGFDGFGFVVVFSCLVAFEFGWVAVGWLVGFTGVLLILLVGFQGCYNIGWVSLLLDLGLLDVVGWSAGMMVDFAVLIVLL